MTPRINDQVPQPDSRAWWLPSRNMCNELLSFYNNNIAPSQLDLPSPYFTKQIFQAIITHQFGLLQLEDANHILTLPCKIAVRRSNSLTYILCDECSNLLHQDGHTTDTPTNIVGGQHAVFDRTIAHLIIRMPSLWCAKCRKALFLWTPENECISNAVFH